MYREGVKCSVGVNGIEFCLVKFGDCGARWTCSLYATKSTSEGMGVVG